MLHVLIPACRHFPSLSFVDPIVLSHVSKEIGEYLVMAEANHVILVEYRSFSFEMSVFYHKWLIILQNQQKVFLTRLSFRVL